VLLQVAREVIKVIQTVEKNILWIGASI